MKDYSKYFQNTELTDIDSSYGFITRLEVVGEEVRVWTPKTKKSEPRKYSINELPYFLEKLEKQYQTVIDNEKTIKNDCIKPKKRAFTIIILTIMIALVTKSIFLMNADALQLGLTLLAGSLMLGPSSMFFGLNKIEEKFDQELDIYQDFLEKRNDIEKQAKIDKNITENLSRSTTKRIASKEMSKEKGTTSQIYDINFMDKTSLTELRKILENYNQSKSLFEEQKFVNPNEKKEEQGKIRTLKK